MLKQCKMATFHFTKFTGRLQSFRRARKFVHLKIGYFRSAFRTYLIVLHFNKYILSGRPSTLHATAAGTLIGVPAAAISRTSGKTLFPAGSPATNSCRTTQHLVSLLEQPDPLPHLPQLALLRGGDAGTVPIFDVCFLQPTVQTPFGNPKVLRDLLQR